MTHPPGPRDSDVASIDAILHALYDVISGPPGERDWGRERHLMLPGARMIPTGWRPNGDDALQVLDAEAYIASVRPHFREHGFFESEIARRVERFGDIAHVFSTYESRHRPDDAAPFVRGINSIQLLQRGGRWWVVTVFWQNESAAVPIPAQYLPPA